MLIYMSRNRALGILSLDISFIGKEHQGYRNS
jgi:hypothetical protein